MGTVNYIKGLYGPIRVGYPLGFSPSGIIDPTTGLALPTTAVIGGAGYSTTYPEISNLASARFLEWNLKTTNTGSGEVYGEYMSLQSAGTGTGYVYTKGALAKSVAGGYVAELGACYYKTQLSAGTVTGQNYVGFFEYVVDTGVANMPSGGCIQLDDIVSGTLNAVHGYIAIRTYGTYPFSNLFNIMDHTSGTGKLFYGCTLKNRIGTTAYYIPLSTAENTLTFSGIVSITNTTDATSTTAGALVVAGGIACAKKLFLGDNLDVSTAAMDIVAKANTAVAIEFYDATTKFVAIDTRNTVSADMVTFTCIPDTITAAAGVTRRVVNIVPGTTTLTGSTGVDDMVGVALLVGRPTITDASAVTVAKASTMCITNAPAAGGSVTITAALALEVAAGKSLFRGDVDFGVDATGWDVTFYGETTAYKVWWDQNGDTNGAWFFGADTKGVQVNLYGDVTGCGVFWDPTTDTNGTLSIGATGGSKGNDVFMYGATNGNYLKWDQSANELMLVGTATALDIAGTTESISTATGSIHTAGGLGVAGDCYLGDDVFLSDGAVINFNAGEVTITNGTNTLDVASTWATGGAAEELFAAIITTNATLGSYANALFGKIDCSATGKSVGILGAVGSEIDLPTGGTQGGYYCFQGDINFPTGATITPFGSHAGFFYLSVWGAGVADFDTDGRFFSLNGLTAGAGKLLSVDKQTLKVDFDNGTARYLVLSQAENYLSVVCATLGNTNDRIASFKGTQATPAMADGYGVIENELTVTGTATGQINLTSSWINLGTAAVVPDYMAVHTDGIWDGTATLTNAYISMQKYTCQLASNPAWLSIWELNYQQDANNVVNALFNVNDAARGLGWVAATPTAAASGSIPFFSVAGGAIRYIRTYDSPSA